MVAWVEKAASVKDSHRENSGKALGMLTEVGRAHVPQMKTDTEQKVYKKSYFWWVIKAKPVGFLTDYTLEEFPR